MSLNTKAICKNSRLIRAMLKIAVWIFILIDHKEIYLSMNYNDIIKYAFHNFSLLSFHSEAFNISHDDINKTMWR